MGQSLTSRVTVGTSRFRILAFCLVKTWSKPFLCLKCYQSEFSWWMQLTIYKSCRVLDLDYWRSRVAIMAGMLCHVLSGVKCLLRRLCFKLTTHSCRISQVLSLKCPSSPSPPMSYRLGWIPHEACIISLVNINININTVSWIYILHLIPERVYQSRDLIILSSLRWIFRCD